MSVSVVIPTYNRAALVLDAVDSALAQEPAVLEVLVCDDQSTDDTRASLAEVQDSRVRVLTTPQRGGGPAAPRNLGLGAARGEWVAFLDDDDRWLPGKLERQQAAFASADVVAANARRRGDGTPYFEHAPSPEMLARDNVLITSSVVARTSLLREVNGFTQRRARQGLEDYETWLALLDRGARFAILDEILLEYRDEGADRFGAASAARPHRQLASLHARRWARRPLDLTRARTAASAFVTWRRG